MQIPGNAVDALSTGREGVESLVDWFAANSAELPIGLAVAGIIVLFMLGLRWFGTWLIAGDPHGHRWRRRIRPVPQKTTIFFMESSALSNSVAARMSLT